MADHARPRVALLWRGPPGADPSATRNYERLGPVFAALSAVRVGAEPILYSDAGAGSVREQLLGVDGVLVWVDPIAGGETRETLNNVLRAVASTGVWVSAHPDTIDKIGTKEVLYRTRSLGWGTDTRLYETMDSFRAEFPACLHAAGPRVLKQNRGNGGLGVWKVSLVDADAPAASATDVSVQHAAPRDDVAEVMTLPDFVDRCSQYFTSGGMLVDQPYVARISDGMIRAYMVRRRVVGYARQSPAPVGDTAALVLGLPSAKTMYPADTPEFATLRSNLEADWIPGLCELVGLHDEALPMLWDADFLFGPRHDSGEETYVLCEINVSSVLPFPDDAPAALAAAVRDRLDNACDPRSH
jgi:hypothetical protein